jgi:hypothetical protein
MKAAMMIVTVFALAAILGCQTMPQGESAFGRIGQASIQLAMATSRSAELSGREPVMDSNTAAADANGPTVHLSYSAEAIQGNPIRSFMYFIPLISPATVRCDSGANDDQQAGIISYTKHVDSRSFYVKCEFQMAGKGFNRYVFDPAGMIALRCGEAKPGETLAHMLDYIRFEGEGFGCLEVRGTVSDANETVTEVSVEFNARGRESPVTIGLYELKARDGQYSYANRSGEIVARVNTLTFKKSEEPRMGISVASICKKAQRAGLFSWFKATVANLFIKPVRVDKRGNDTMLDFGHALARQENVFTFPKARNLKDTTLVATGPAQEQAGFTGIRPPREPRHSEPEAKDPAPE